VKRLFALLALAGAAVAVLFVAGSATAAKGGDVQVVPVAGKSVGHGLKLWVFVYYAQGGKKGPPGGGGGGSGSCSNDDNTQTGYAAPFAAAGPLTFHVSEGTVPGGLNVDSALGTAAGSWNGARANLLSVKTDGSETSPAQNGTSTIGWANLVPKRVLAATWTYTNSSKQVVEADIFFNKAHPWATLYPTCPASSTGDFDVADIGTHEMGHALGLNHYSDSGAQATMYPSAPSDEIRKVTLTTGDKAALTAALALNS
jgi:hypothetical protein